jgi:hypothetical protein
VPLRPPSSHSCARPCSRPCVTPAGWMALQSSEMNKIHNAFFVVAVPEQDDEEAEDAKNKRKRRVENYVAYDQERMELSLVISFALFNCSTKIAGASLGKPPASLGRAFFNFSTREWQAVDSGPRPTPKMLKECAEARPLFTLW